MFGISNNTNTYDYMNSFFGGLNSNGQTGSSYGTSNLLGDYYSIKNGTYLKVAKKFYASEEGKNVKFGTTAEIDEKQTELIKNDAEAVLGSLSKLMNSSLYKKVETTDESGNKILDYDRKGIMDNLKAFVEDYNELIKNTAEGNDNRTLKNSVRLVNQAKVYEGALSSIGISIKSNNTLEINEESFDKANMTDVKSLFTGSVSFAKNIQSKLFKVYSSAADALNAVDGIYSANGKGSISIGSMFDNMF